MSKHYTDVAACAKALRLSREPDMDGKKLKAELGVATAREAWHMAELGRDRHRIADCKLTEPEHRLVMAIAVAERRKLAAGSTTRPKGKHVSYSQGKSAGWATSVAARRLKTHRKGEDERQYGTGLRLVSNGGGHISLTAAGWAYVHACEMTGGAS